MNIAINYWAVLVAALVNMAVGTVWYGPLFGKVWKNLMGFTDEAMQNMKMKPMVAMVLGFVTAIVMSYVLAHFAVLSSAAGMVGALQLSFWIWLGFIATNTVGLFVWEGRPFKLFVLNATEQLVAIFLMAVVIVLWK